MGVLPQGLLLAQEVLLPTEAAPEPSAKILKEVSCSIQAIGSKLDIQIFEARISEVES